MRPKLKKLLIALAAVVVLITAFIFVSPYSPLPYYTANPKSYAECMKAHGTYSNDQGIDSCVFKDQLFIDHRPKLKTFTDTVNGFTFEYPGELFREADTLPVIHFLDGKEYESISLVHTIDVEHCDLSGDPGSCTPQTTDMSVGITPIDRDFSEVTAAALKYFGELEEESWGNIAAKSFRAGAEGEGIYYYLVDLGENKTLLMTRTFLDENTLINYQTAAGFIKYERQKQIFDEIMNSLEINK